MQGGICSIITGVVLAYYIITTIITHSVEVQFTTQTNSKLLDTSNNRFIIPVHQMQMYSLIQSSNSTINDNINAYVEGVYVQDQYNAATKSRNQTFYQAIKCSVLFPEK